MTPLLEEYFHLLEKHQKEFPKEQVLLLMQVGSFYEGYEIDEPKRGCAKVLSDVLRMHLTRKNGNKGAAENNPWMVGFPTYVLGKHLGKLNDEGFTVAVYDQKEENKQERGLKGIYNFIMRHESEDEILSTVDRRIFGITLDKYREGTSRVKKVRFLLSSVCVDMSSGAVQVQELDTEDVHRDLQTFLLHFSPPELLLRFEGDFSQEEQSTIESNIRTGSATKLIVCDKGVPRTQQLGLLQELYETREDPVAFLDLQRHSSLIPVLTLVLHYIKKHDPILATKLKKPEFIMTGHRFLEYNRDAFLELNIASVCERRKSYVATKKQKSLLDILGEGMGGLGKRVLDQILRRPITDLDEIQKRHAWIHYFQKGGSHDQEPVRVPDLEWLLLKWKREKITFRWAGQFLSSLRQTYLDAREKYPEFWKDCVQDTLLGEIDHWFNLDKMATGEIDFIRVSSFELEDFEKKTAEYLEAIHRIEDQYKEYFKLTENNDGTYLLSTSVKKWETFQFKTPKHALYEIQKNKSMVKVSCETLDKMSTLLSSLRQQKEGYVLATFQSISRTLLTTHEKDFHDTIQKISEMDCYSSLGRFFANNLYVCPDILADKNKLEVQDLRHPIYEYIEKDKLFVPYSFQLGDSSDTPIGTLLYGMNSSGKSTLLKSTGTAVWLAQCGLFVPAKTFQWSGFHHLFTKIGKYDNLFCGHSTFVAEMSELNYILRKSTPKSLILCDELTSGTESRSATGIVASTLDFLLDRKILFIFTTHLHTISKIPEIRHNTHLSVKHFRVMADSFQSFLVDDIRIRYDRSLHDGSGDDLYGIEIAKTLGLPETFITKAFEYRERVEIFVKDPNESYQVSRYNKNLIMNECQKCGSKNNLHTHHITPQKEFAKNPSIHHKNGLYNLAVLCEPCHQETHHPTAAEPAKPAKHTKTVESL